VAADWGRETRASGAALRTGLVAGALVVGLIVAIVLLPAAHPWLHDMHREH